MLLAVLHESEGEPEGPGVLENDRGACTGAVRAREELALIRTWLE